MRKLIQAAGLLAALALPSTASAATVRCGIEKPTHRGFLGVIELSHLTATNLPTHEPSQGNVRYSPCRMANRLAEQYEKRAVSSEDVREFPYAYEPAFLTVNGWREPSRWHVKDMAYHDRGNEVNWTAVFIAGKQRVSVRVVEPLEAGPPEPEHAGE